MPDERAAADQVAAFWDALVRDQPTDEFAVEEELAAALTRFQAMGSAMPATPRERVWREVQPAPVDRHEFAHPRSLPVLYARPPVTRGEAAVQPPRASARPGRLFPHLATAALLVLTIALGLIALDPARLHRGEPRLPIGAPTYPSASETVFSVNISPEQVPVASSLHYFVWRLSLDPGRSTTMPVQERTCCDGPRLTYVLEGELTMRTDGPMQVFRRGELAPGARMVSPGTAVVLHPGDTVTYDDAAPTAYANDGADPVQLISAGLSERKSLESWVATMNYLDGSDDFLPGPLPAGSMALSLVRATLAPDGEFPAPPPGSGVLEVGEHGDASIGKQMDGSLFNINRTAETIYVFIVQPLGVSTLTP